METLAGAGSDSRDWMGAGPDAAGVKRLRAGPSVFPFPLILRRHQFGAPNPSTPGHQPLPQPCPHPLPTATPTKPMSNPTACPHHSHGHGCLQVKVSEVAGYRKSVPQMRLLQVLEDEMMQEHEDDSMRTPAALVVAWFYLVGTFSVRFSF